MSQQMTFDSDLAPNARDMLRAVLCGLGSDERTADALFKRYGSLPGVAAADTRSLRAGGLSESAAEFLGYLRPLASIMAAESVSNRNVIGSWSALVNYIRAGQACDPRESFRCLFLDRKNRLIADEVLGKGTIDHAPVYPREVARRALALDASAVILVHNHPSGDPTPSAADIEMTKSLVKTLKSLDIVVHDHLVIAAEGTASLKTLGLM